MKGHPVQGDSKLLAVHPVHEGKDQDPAREETQEDHDAIDSVQPRVVEAQLNKTEKVGEGELKYQPFVLNNKTGKLLKADAFI